MLPILLPLCTAVVMIFFRKRVLLHRMLNAAGTAAMLGVSLVLLSSVYAQGILSLQVGGWDAPFGITFVADMLSSIMVVATAFIGLTTALYSLGTIDEDREHFFYYPLLQILLMGINGAFLTGDIFNLY
ncbi:MAG: Na+/H+ antiporter subunit D, partial [Chlorobiales bacterium]|nr:Na+/H+ antiporter subunit D [Chlorobiales bacterium]